MVALDMIGLPLWVTMMTMMIHTILTMPAVRNGRNGQRGKPFRREALRRRNGRKVFGGPVNLGQVKVIPQKMLTHFNYNVLYDVASGAVLAPNSYTFRFLANSVYAPDLNTAFENFPTGVPQFAALYQQYQVVRVSARFQLTASGTLPDTTARFVAFAHPYTGALPTGAAFPEDFQGQPMASRIINFGPVSGHSVSAPLFVNRRTTSVLSRPANQCDCAVDLSGRLLASNPTTQWFITVVVAVSAPVLPAGAVTLQTSLNFQVRLFQPSLLQISRFAPVFTTNDKPDDISCPYVCKEDEEKEGGVVAPLALKLGGAFAPDPHVEVLPVQGDGDVLMTSL